MSTEEEAGEVNGDTTETHKPTAEAVAVVEAKFKEVYGSKVEDDEPDDTPEEEDEEAAEGEDDSQDESDDAPPAESKDTEPEGDEVSDEEEDEDSPDDEEAEDEPDIDPKLLAAAKAGRLSDEDARKLAKDNPNALEALRSLHVSQSTAFSKYGRTNQQNEVLSQENADLKAKLAQLSSEDDSDVPDESFEGGLKFDPETYTMEDAKRLTDMADKVDRFEAYFQEQQQRQAVETIDQFFDGLDKELYPQFGNTKYSSFEEDSPEWQAIDAIRQEAAIQQKVAADFGTQMSDSDALNRAILIHNPDAPTTAAKKDLKKKVKRRSKQVTARPTRRETPAKKKTGMETLHSRLDQWGAEHPEAASLVSTEEDFS